MQNHPQTYTPPMPPTRQRLRTEKRRSSFRLKLMRTFGMFEPAILPRLTMPSWLYGRGIIFYFIALAAVTGLFWKYAMPWYYVLSGTISVLLSFGWGQSLSRAFSVEKVREKRFEKLLFYIALLIRIVWVVLIYYIFMQTYGNPFGFENMDAVFYDEMGQYVVKLIEKGKFHFIDELHHWARTLDRSDMGYGIYVGFVYYLTDNSILALRLIKGVWSALTVLLIYRLTRSHFGESVARVAAIFCALWPNFWYYCGGNLKESEMVFLAVLFVEQGDQMLRSRQFTAWKIIPLLLIIGALFMIRTPLAIVAVLALLFTIVMSSSRVVSWGKRIAVGSIAVVLIGVTMGNRIEENARELIETNQGGYQEKNMEWRSTRKDAAGNTQKFAKYAGAAVFAPMIFTIPFSSMVHTVGQDVQQLLNGGNFIKNILSFFTILSMFILLFTGDWRKHLLPLSFMLGYIVVLVVSVFAQSERFHQPVMPFELMFAAYGLNLTVQNKKFQRWFGYWCIIMLVAVVAWGWFKLAGRGLV